MPLTLITGPPNAAKAAEVLGAMRAERRSGAMLVVPTAADVLHYERELAEGPGVVGGRVIRFDDLVAAIAQRTGRHAAIASRLQVERVAAAAAASADLELLAQSAATAGFPASLAAFVGELEAERVAPERLERGLVEASGGDARRRRRGAELAVLHRAVREGLEAAGLEHPHRAGWKTLDALRRRPQAWGGTPVLVYGFDDLTTLQLDAIETLAVHAGAPVTVALTFEAGRAAMTARAGAVAALEPFAGERRDLPAVAEHYAPRSRDALHHLERTLFEAAAPAEVDPAHAIAVLEAGGERAELELVAAELRAQLDAGVEPGDAALVLRGLETSGPLVSGVLDAHGIPHHVAASMRLGATALGRGWLALVRCALDPGAPAGDVVAWLRSPGVLRRPELADELEARVVRGGLRSAEDARRVFTEAAWGFPLGELDRLRAASAQGPAELVAALGRELRRAFAAPRRRAGRPLAPDEEVDGRALAAGLRALDQLAGLARAGAAALPAAPELPAVLARIEVRAGPPSEAGRVQVCDPLDLRARRVRALVVAGLQEGVFPRAPSPDPFLGDDERGELAAAGGPRLRRREDPLGEERALFHALASRPTERLVLACRVSDEEGDPALPSFFVEDVRACFAGGLHQATQRRLVGDVVWPAERAPTERERARAIAASGPPRAAPGIAPLRAPAVLRELGDLERPLSAGALEHYAACPARWLVDRVLRPRALEPDSLALLRGAVGHVVLERVITRLREEGESGVSEATLPRALELMDEELAAAVGDRPLASHPTRADAARRGLRAELVAYLRLEALWAGQARPLAVEVSFGFEDEDPASHPALVLGDGAVRLRGRIDRVDVTADGRGAVVRDYKAREGYKLADWEREDRLQAALYLLAVERLLELEPVAGVYQALRPGGGDVRPRGIVKAERGEEALGAAAVVEGDRAEEERFAEVLAWAERRAVELAESMRGGALEARIERCCGRARRCAHPGVCRSGA